MSSSSVCRPVVYDDAVTSADLDEWDHEFDALMARVRPLFYRAESKKHAEQYIRGLLSPLARKNGWTIAEYVGEPEPTALQRLLNLSPWDVDALLALNREYAMANFADPGGLLVADPTGFAKKGRKSVGVQRQYSGTLGRIDNCQIATFLAYVTPRRDRVLIDRRLYLPEQSWMGDPDRCAEAGVPAQVTFQTRPQQVQEMIEAALAAGVPFAWFTADEEFGQNPGLCAWLERERLPYVMAIPKNTTFLDTRRHIPHDRGLRPTTAPKRLATPRLRHRSKRAPRLRLGAHRVHRTGPPIPDPTVHHRQRTRVLPLLQPEPGRIRRTRPRSRRTMANRRMLRVQQERDSSRQLPGPHLAGLAPTHHIRHARPHLPRGHRSQGQKKGHLTQNPTQKFAETDKLAPRRRRLIPLTLAEVRRLINLDRHNSDALTHGLYWSIFRRSHQAAARRAHVRRHLSLQTLVI